MDIYSHLCLTDVSVKTALIQSGDGLPQHEDTFDYSKCDIPTFTRDAGREHVALAAYSHRDPDFALDPLSSSRQFQPNSDLAVLGMVVVASPTPDGIQVLVPDCTVPPVGVDVRIDLRHVVELSMGPAFNMGHDLPHQTSLRLYALIHWSLLWTCSAELIGRRSTPCWPNGAVLTTPSARNAVD